MVQPAIPRSQAVASRAVLAYAGRVVGRRRTVIAAVPLSAIDRNPRQPRQHFDPVSLEDLASSIRSRGILQPVMVQPAAANRYTLVAGERRLRAAEMAGLTVLPAVFCEGDLLEVALEENLQREDLSPIEEAAGLAALAEDRGLSHGDLAGLVHKSRPYVSNTLALNRLPMELRAEILSSDATVPREILIAIARQADEPGMRKLWRRVQLDQMSVRGFRRTQGRPPAADRNVAVRIEATARKLRRLLRALDGETAVSPDVGGHLAGSLRRTARLIDRAVRWIESGAEGKPGRAVAPTRMGTPRDRRVA